MKLHGYHINIIFRMRTLHTSLSFFIIMFKSVAHAIIGSKCSDNFP